MKKLEGKIIVKTNLKNNKEDETITIEQLLKAEQYLNNEVAIDIHKKFGIGIRVHF